ncbi:TOMM precursor leader peptide-binding protein [Streptomyces sp. PR69]|uniref:TOMM precursor leader peptide-binding protein n=1 Tax=Streptomyces sp. PR69 TaxID=2984950 RepID=UPI002264B6B5|nr:TOMM precursor leader peptide-binding protein [Streptomyces sp. PR69]
MESLWPRIGFRRHLTTAVVPGEATYLVSEQGVTAIEGHAVAALAPLLDGSRDLSALVRDTQGVLSPTELGAVLAKLRQANLITGSAAAPADDGPDSDAAAFWEAAGLDAQRAAETLAAGRVRLLDLSRLDGADVRDALTEAGVVLGLPSRVGGDRGVCDLTVVLCDDYLLPALADVDAAQRRSGRPWLLAKPHGVEPWIGPVFQPGAGPCWHCLAHRLRSHRSPEHHVCRALGLDAPPSPPPSAIAASRSLALRGIALEAAKWLAGYRDGSQSSIRVLDTLHLGVRPHTVARRPQCPQCGDPALVGDRVRRPVVLVSRPKTTLSEGGHRALTAEQVLERYEHLVGRVTGVVTGLERAPGGPAFLNSYHSGPNPALTHRTLAGFRSSLRSQSGGKGTTALDAKVGALCEAVERYSGTLHGDEPRIRGRFAELADEAVHPNDCQLYHERQYATRLEWNASQPPFQYVCDPFDEQAVIDWTPVWSLTRGRRRLLPTALLYCAPPPASGPCFALADSNGNAAGGSLEDAVLQGFFELVERDAVALWWYNRTRQPRVDLESFPDPWIDEMHTQYARLKREFWVLDVTSDLGVPAMAAVSRRTDKPEEDIMFGFGCHFDPVIALRRALTELNQLLPAVLGPSPADDPALADWCARRTVANQPYLGPDPSVPARRRADYPYTLRADLLDDIHAAEALLRERGLELLVLDQTRPDLELPTVKVVVPGLRHFWARFGPGRLYDIPVQLGRRTRPIAYEELNPVPLFV